MSPWLLAARPKTLPAAVAPVLLACALAAHDGVFAFWPAFFALLFALLIQIGTNYSNDYFDFVKGADTPLRIGPTRAVASGMVSPEAMAKGTAIVFGLALLVGLCLIPYGGWGLLPLGIICILAGLAYTGGPFPLAYNGWSDLFVLVFFGVVAVCATYYVQAGVVSHAASVLSLAPGALAVNILVVNNYRDVDTDRKAHKRTLIVRFGRRAGILEYMGMLLIANAVPIYLFSLGMSWKVLLPLVLLPLGLVLLRSLLFAWERRTFNRLLGGTAAYLLLYSILLGAGLIL